MIPLESSRLDGVASISTVDLWGSLTVWRRQPMATGHSIIPPNSKRGELCVVRRDKTGMLVCPAKAGVFSGKQSHQGKSQDPCSLDSQEEGN